MIMRIKMKYIYLDSKYLRNEKKLKTYKQKNIRGSDQIMEYEPCVEKCMKCVHCYQTKNDADELRCRCRNGCNFKEVTTNNGQKGGKNERY